MSYSVEDQVAALKSWVGFHEGPNNANPFSVWHGYGTRYLPWCASFAQYCAVEMGGFVWKSPYAQFGPKGSGYVPTVARDAQHMGIWRPTSARARPGWQVHFDWNHDGTQDHDETVITDDGTDLITIGGNTSDAVLYRKRNRRDVAGFCALDEAGQNIQLPTLERTMILQTYHYDAHQKAQRIADKRQNGRWLLPTIGPSADGKALILKDGASFTGAGKSGADDLWPSPDVGAHGPIISVTKKIPQDGTPELVVVKHADGWQKPIRMT